MAKDNSRAKARSMMKECGYALGGAVRRMAPGPAMSAKPAAVPVYDKRQPGKAAAAAVGTGGSTGPGDLAHHSGVPHKPRGPAERGLGAAGFKRGGRIKP